jgi:hypothetical protein
VSHSTALVIRKKTIVNKVYGKTMLANRTHENLNERLPSPGIPGDYFECDEIMLVQKLNLLRSAQPLQVPSLLDSTYTNHHDEISLSGSDVSSEDLFISTAADDYSPNMPQDAFTRSKQRQLSTVVDMPVSVISNKREPPPKNEKSWEGFDLVLKDEMNPSVPCDSSPRSSSNFPDNVLLFKHIRRPRTVNGGCEDSKSHATPATASMSISYASTSSYSQRRQQLRKKFKFPAEVTLRKNGSGTEQDDCQHVSPLHHELTIKKSSSSSSPTNDVEEDDSSQSYGSESFLQDELFVKLSEDSDLEAFKVVNNFSFEGDYLFSRILRERTRIQMKKNMLKDGDVDLLCDLRKREVSGRNADRGVYYEI